MRRSILKKRRFVIPRFIFSGFLIGRVQTSRDYLTSGSRKKISLFSGLDTGFTSIDVDAQVLSPEGSLYDVIFVGTSTGANLVGTGNMAKNNGLQSVRGGHTL